MSFFGVNWETENGEYSCTSKNMDMVEMGKNVDDKFRWKVLDGGMHNFGVKPLTWRIEYEVGGLSEADN